MGLRKLEKKDSQAIEEIIDRGGSVRADKAEKKKEWTNVTIRTRKDLLVQVDEIVEERIGMTRTAWILEALQEKLKREKAIKKKVMTD